MPRKAVNKTGVKRQPTPKPVEAVKDEVIIKPVLEMSEEEQKHTSNIDVKALDDILKRLEQREKALDEKEQSLRELVERVENTKPGLAEDKSHKKFGTAVRKEIPVSDRLRQPKTYIYTGGIYVMSVYELPGIGEVYAPYEKPIVFSSEQTISKKTMDGMKHYRLSLYSTYSKAECKFIEDSPEFKMTIFENTSQAMKAPIELTYQIQKASRMIGALPDNTLLQMAIDYKIDMDLPMSEIRYMLKQYKLAEILQEESTTTSSLVQSVFGDKGRTEMGLPPVESNR